MSIIKDTLFGKAPKVERPPPPPNTPTRADAEQGIGSSPAFQSLISTGKAGGLKRRATTSKRSLIGGSA